MKKEEEFIAVYKEYENTVREQGKDPKEHEETVDPSTQGRLRMLRYFRNYLVHQSDPGFITVNDAQIKFLKEYTFQLKSRDDIVKKHIKSASAATCQSTDRCTDALTKCIKFKTDKIIVIDSKTGYGSVSIYDIASRILETKTAKLSEIKPKKEFHFIAPSVKMENTPSGVLVCTDNGTADGKLLGVLYPAGQ